MRNTSIIIVEDEAIVAADLAGKLSRMGYEVKATALCGEEAISLAREHRPDILLMDIRLAGAMDGVEAAEIIRSEFDLPVIFLTSHSDRATFKRAKQSEPFGYLLKPFEESGLQAQIEMALYKHDTERKLRKLNDELELRVEERTRELRESEQRLREINETLEQRVADRTAELQESEGLYRLLFSNMNEAFFLAQILCDDAGKPCDYRYLDINPAFEANTGKTREQVVGKTVREVFPNPNPSTIQTYGRVALEGEAARFEVFRESLGRHFDIVGFQAGQGRFGSLFRDITERKLAEEALRHSERLYRAIGESIDYGIWVCDPDGRNTYASESFLNMVGITQEQCSNFGWGSVLHPDDAENTIAEWKECVRTEGVWDIEHRFRGTDGQWHPVLARGVPVRNDRGELICWAGINLDISGLKRVEEELQKAKDDLEFRVAERTKDLATTLDTLFIEIAERQRAEKLLRHSEERYRQVVEDQTEIICRFKADGTFTFVNDVYCRIFGKTREELFGKKWQPEAFPDDVPIIEEQLRTMSPSNPVVVIENRVYSGSGEIRWMQFVNRGFFDKEGLIIETQAVGRDITDRKLADEARRESEERLSMVLNNSLDGINMLDLHTGRYVFMSPAQVKLTGFTLEEINGITAQEAYERVHPDDRELSVNQHRQVVAGGDVGPVEYRWQVKSGEYRWFSDSRKLVRDAQGRPVALVGVSRDITERKQIEQALRGSEERLTLALEGGRMGLWEWDTRNDRSIWNAMEYKLLGLPVGDGFVATNQFFDRVHPEDIGPLNQVLTCVMKSGSDFYHEIRIIRADDGRERWLAAVGKLFRDADDQPLKMLGVNYDITERKLFEAELQAANKTMNRLVRTIAHEFRTPLGLLTGSVDILDRYWDRLTPKKRLERNEQIRNAAYQISNLVNSVTSFQLSREERDTLPPLVQDIGEICRSIATEVETVWGKGHEFIVSIAVDCGSAVMDDILFRRILQNLLTNAFRYTPADGTVSLRISREKSRLLLEISDTGIGIPEEEQALIFDAFYRSGNVEGRRGLGLGLSIVKEALSQMGGSITVTSNLGVGTTMGVVIPLLDHQVFQT